MMTRKEVELATRIQSLVGIARGNYQNDRDPNRAENVDKPLRETFALCLKLLAPYPPVMPKE